MVDSTIKDVKGIGKDMTDFYSMYKMKDEDKPWEPSQLAKRVHIVAFGTIDEVYVA
jgi:hypothetical protein